MKVLALCATGMLVAFSPTLNAQGLKLVQTTSTSSTTINAPSGIDVPGCTYYRFDTKYPATGDVREVCNTKSIENIRYQNRNEAAGGIGTDRGASND